MIVTKDDLGFPKLKGVDDWADSAHCCGLLEFIDSPEKVDAFMYVLAEATGYRYVRHPKDGRYDMSRDNALLLMYALWKQGKGKFVNLDYIDGKDLYSPAVSGFVRKINGKEPFFWQKWWFRKELETNWDFQRIEEPFQIIVMCDVYGKEWLKLWTDNNKLWRYAIRRYLSELDGAWRASPELADLFIKKVEDKLK